MMNHSFPLPIVFSSRCVFSCVVRLESVASCQCFYYTRLQFCTGTVVLYEGQSLKAICTLKSLGTGSMSHGVYVQYCTYSSRSIGGLKVFEVVTLVVVR